MTDFIDVHTHIFRAETLKQYQAKIGAWRGQLLALQYWTGRRSPKHSLGDLLAFTEANTEVSVVAAVNPNYSVAEQLGALADVNNKLVGIKMYPGYEHFYPTAFLVESIAQWCLQYHKPLILHSGDCSARGTPLLKYAHPLHIDELAVRYPELVIVIAHLGFPWFMDAANVMHKNRNVYADLSGVIDIQESRELARLTRRYADDLSRVLDYFPDVANKLMFGTDFSGDDMPLSVVEPYFAVVNRVFEGRTRRNVYHDTAQKIFFPPAP